MAVAVRRAVPVSELVRALQKKDVSEVARLLTAVPDPAAIRTEHGVSLLHLACIHKEGEKEGLTSHRRSVPGTSSLVFSFLRTRQSEREQLYSNMSGAINVPFRPDFNSSKDQHIFPRPHKSVRLPL